jgi:transglutaminase-like putative cysteine protease
MTTVVPIPQAAECPSHPAVSYSIHHRVSFSYGGAVAKNRNQVRLCPQSDERQSCESFELRTNPEAHARQDRDQFGNHVHGFEIKTAHRSLILSAHSVVSLAESRNAPPADAPLSESAAFEISVLAETTPYFGLSPYVPHVPEVEELVHAAEKESGGSTTGFAETAAGQIRSQFRYRSGVTHVASTIADVFQTKGGVCQDFAHLLLAILRWRGISARYVSGYVAPGYLGDPLYKGDRLFRTTAGHAWVEFFLPSAGWVGIDPTLGVWPGPGHIKLACGRDYGDAAPVSGVYQGSEQSSVQSMIEISALPKSVLI